MVQCHTIQVMSGPWVNKTWVNNYTGVRTMGSITHYTGDVRTMGQ